MGSLSIPGPMPPRMGLPLLLHLRLHLLLLQILHLHPVLMLETSASIADAKSTPFSSAWPDAATFKPRSKRSTPRCLRTSSRESLALPVVSVTVHLPVLNSLLPSLQLAHHLWLLDLQLLDLPDQRRCLHLLPLNLLTSSSSTKFQEISSLSFPTPARTLPKLLHEDCRGLGGRWVSKTLFMSFPRHLLTLLS